MYFSMSAAPWPKRFVTILTSSGCDTSLGMGGSPFSAGIGLNLSAIAVENTRNTLRRQVIVEVVIHLDGRGPAARPDAFHLFQGEDAVRGNALVADAQLFLEALVEVIGAAQHATDIGADLDIEFACGLETQHGVVTGHIAHFELGKAQPVGNLGHHRVGKVADLILRVEQHGDQRRTLHGVLLNQHVKARRQRGRKDRHGLRTGFPWAHAINSCAHASATISISSSRSPSFVPIRLVRSRPCSVNSIVPALPSSRFQWTSAPARSRSSHASPWRTVIRSSPNSTVACVFLFSPCAAV